MVTDQPTWIWSDCEHCGTPFAQPYDPGRRRRCCCGRCRTAAYRARKRHQQQERQREERWRRAYQDGYRRSYEEAGRRQRERARQRASQPPPHAGTSRPGTWCGPCGGVRGHTPTITTTRPTSAPAAATTACVPRRPRPATRTRPTPATPKPTRSATSTASNLDPEQASGHGRNVTPRAAGRPNCHQPNVTVPAPPVTIRPSQLA